MKVYLEKISHGEALSFHEAAEVMQSICNASQDTIPIAAFLGILHARGETHEELSGFMKTLRSYVHYVPMEDPNIMAMCGTGGDYAGTFNISSTSALILGSSGVKIAQHVGRSTSSQCGSANVLEALGIPLCQDADTVRHSFQQHGVSFLSALHFNPILKQLAPLRKALGIRSCFNLLAPLLNPIPLRRRVFGVYSSKMLLPLAHMLNENGTEEAMLVHSHDGLDEISISAPTEVVHLRHGTLTSYQIHPHDVGLPLASLDDIQGGDVHTNAKIIEDILSGEKGPRRDVVLLNAAAGFVISGKVKTLREGVQLASESIDSGKAKNFLQQLRGKPYA